MVESKRFIFKNQNQNYTIKISLKKGAVCFSKKENYLLTNLLKLVDLQNLLQVFLYYNAALLISNIFFCSFQLKTLLLFLFFFLFKIL